MTSTHRLLTCALLALAAVPTFAETLSGNLTTTSGGSETATGNIWLTSSFTTGASAYTLDSITLLLANPTAEWDVMTVVFGMVILFGLMVMSLRPRRSW